MARGLEGGEIGDVDEVHVVGRRRAEAFELRDGIEVEPTELNPHGAPARGLEIGEGSPSGVEGMHAGRRQHNIGGGGAGVGR